MSFKPDSANVARVLPSPNHGERVGDAIDMLILHYTGMPTAEAALARLCDPAAEVSAHYVVLEDGSVLQLVPEARRAWHAGRACWMGNRDLNSCSIGIEIAHPGHDGGLPPYPEAQIEGVIGLARDILARRAIAPVRVLAHSDVAPERKEDPGENFPWDRLWQAGIGHWTAPTPPGTDDGLALGASGESVEFLQGLFAVYGYDQPVTGTFDVRTQAVVTAFQRHFRQARIDGVADASTIATLRDLIAARPG